MLFVKGMTGLAFLESFLCLGESDFWIGLGVNEEGRNSLDENVRKI